MTHRDSPLYLNDRFRNRSELKNKPLVKSLAAAMILAACGGPPPEGESQEADLGVPNDVETISQGAAAGAPGPFLEGTDANRLTVMEAENFSRKIAGPSEDNWTLKTALAGASNGKYMQVTPDDGSVRAVNFAAATVIEYDVKISTPGAHTVIVRSANCGPDSGSVHLAIDGTVAASNWAVGTGCAWSWSKRQVNITGKGVHRLRFAMHKDGFILDKVILTTNATYNPTGSGPSQTARMVLNPKYNFGHYIALIDARSDAVIADAASKAGVKGVQVRYLWRDLESTLGNYTFDEVKHHLDLLQSQNKKLVVMVTDKTFDGTVPSPNYLADYSVYYSKINHSGEVVDGYDVMRWKPYVIARMGALIRALANAFESHPAFAGIATQETAMSTSQAELDANGYTPEIYRNAIIETITQAKVALPNNEMFWYMNFIPEVHKGKVGQLRFAAEALARVGVTMGGPDILPEDNGLLTRAYPLYKFPNMDDTGGFAGKMNLFCSAQNVSHYHVKSATGQFYTPLEIFQYARDQLNVKYVFWNRKTFEKQPGDYKWTDDLPVIAANPSFNLSLAP